MCGVCDGEDFGGTESAGDVADLAGEDTAAVQLDFDILIAEVDDFAAHDLATGKAGSLGIGLGAGSVAGRSSIVCSAGIGKTVLGGWLCSVGYALVKDSHGSPSF